MKSRNRILAILAGVILALGILACGGYYCARRYSYPLSAFQDCAKFYTDFTDSSLDVVNLGSTTGKFAFDWSGSGVRGGNFATAPQCGTYDFALLKKYKMFLAPGAVVLMTLCPFSCLCSSDFPMPEARWYAKYYALLDREEMTYYDPKTALRVWTALNVVRPNWCGEVKKSVASTDSHASNIDEREARVAQLGKAWMTQFNLVDLSRPVPVEKAEAVIWNVKVYRQMIDWCRVNGFKPVFVMPPLATEFDRLLTDEFYKHYVDEFMVLINRSDVPYYDYSHASQFRDRNPSLFFDGFCLNKKGRELFTKEIAARLCKDGLLKVR